MLAVYNKQGELTIYIRIASAEGGRVDEWLRCESKNVVGSGAGGGGLYGEYVQLYVERDVDTMNSEG
jgi:hypothetical protein